MNVAIEKPELKRYIEEQVNAGRFATAEDLVAMSLAHFISEQERAAADHEIDGATVERLNTAYARNPRGESGHSIEDAREILLGRRRDR